MKNKHYLAKSLLTTVMILFFSCDDEPTSGSATLPSVNTAEVTGLTPMSAQCGGTVTSDGGLPVTGRGVCWSIYPSPSIDDDKTTDGTGTGSFTSDITGLTPDTTYYVRAYATNSLGTGYGSVRSFITAVTDIDGNVYRTVKIGDQWWMVENLKVTRYRNGDAIPNVTDRNAWSDLSTGAYCSYDNDPANAETYGHLYNWYAVNDPRGLAPEGWHVPSDAEWQTLIDYLGGFTVAGGNMKEAGTTHWTSPNAGATNESGFSALPGGYRLPAGYRYQYASYEGMGEKAYFWSSTEKDRYTVWYRYLGYTGSGVFRSYYLIKESGFSLRAVKD